MVLSKMNNHVHRTKQTYAGELHVSTPYEFLVLQLTTEIQNIKIKQSRIVTVETTTLITASQREKQFRASSGFEPMAST